MRKGFYLFFLLLNIGVINAQKKHFFQNPLRAIDSIKSKLPSISGLKKVDALIDIAYLYQSSEEALARKYSNDALKLAQELKYNKGIISAYLNLAVSEMQHSKFEESLSYSLKALKICELTKDTIKSAESYLNIANSYLNMNNFSYAISNYKKAGELFKQVGDTINVGTVYNNLAVSYDNRDILDTALVYYNLAFPIYNKTKNKKSIGLWYMNVGDLFRKQDKIKEALAYQLKAEPILIEANDLFTLMVLYSGLPYTYIELHKHDDALVYANKAIALGIKLKSTRELSYAYMALADVYEAMGNYKEESLNIRKYASLNDSIFSEETSHTIAEMQSKYENEKKQKEIELKNVEIEKHEAKQTFYIGTVVAIILVVLLLVIGIRNKNKANNILQLQKKEIERQKHLVDEKQKEIIDSINYAKRLQQAILATPEEISKHFSDNFLLYKPKDIVAGDFYFFETTDTHIFYAAADCTGHGVPGALVSVVCSNALFRCVKEFKLTDPGKILDKTRELVLETFAKSSSDVKDGMDISFLAINKINNKVLWSGANNPLWYIQNKEFKQIKANKQPIGKTEISSSFTTHEIEYIKDSVFYLFTDGYADQFGGDKGKKFKYKQLEELLFQNEHLPFNQQSEILNQRFENWKGNLEQVDDVCVIGIKI